jgi:hypothetical protein
MGNNEIVFVSFHPCRTHDHSCHSAHTEATLRLLQLRTIPILCHHLYAPTLGRSRKHSLDLVTLSLVDHRIAFIWWKCPISAILANLVLHAGGVFLCPGTLYPRSSMLCCGEAILGVDLRSDLCRMIKWTPFRITSAVNCMGARFMSLRWLCWCLHTTSIFICPRFHQRLRRRAIVQVAQNVGSSSPNQDRWYFRWDRRFYQQGR